MSSVVLTAIFVRSLFKVCTVLSLALKLLIASEKIAARLGFVFYESLELFLILMNELLRERAIHKEVLHISLGQFYFSGHFAICILNVDFSANYW